MNQAEMIARWDEHVSYEFSTRDVSSTIATMVEDAYVNHVPVMTGGYGHEALRRFYKEDFISPMPADTSIQLVSRTLGQEQLVDEIIFSFTHTEEIPWMLPGVPPTHCHVDIPLVVVLAFAMASWRASASTGTRHLCSNKSVCSQIHRFRYLGPRPHTSSWI
jgi:carboxymethylenebutenolidase